MNDTDIITFIGELLHKLEVPFDSVERVATRMHPLYVIHTSDSGVLIGAHGETLNALNVVIQKCLEAKFPSPSEGTVSTESRFAVDVNGYKLKRIKTVEETAQQSAEKVHLFKHDVEMSPMSAYDRLIVHSLLAHQPDIKTESLGDGEMRRVVIRYAGTT